MELYLIRHADAIALGENNVHTDEDRPLSAAGQQQAKELASGLQKKGVALLVEQSPCQFSGAGMLEGIHERRTSAESLSLASAKPAATFQAGLITGGGTRTTPSSLVSAG